MSYTITAALELRKYIGARDLYRSCPACIIRPRYPTPCYPTVASGKWAVTHRVPDLKLDISRLVQRDGLCKKGSFIFSSCPALAQRYTSPRLKSHLLECQSIIIPGQSPQNPRCIVCQHGSFLPLGTMYAPIVDSLLVSFVSAGSHLEKNRAHRKSENSFLTKRSTKLLLPTADSPVKCQRRY
jgi:hypothetical protein